MISRKRALLYATFSALLGALAYWLGVGSFLGQRAEASVLEASAFNANPPAPLSLVSVTSTLIALGIIALIALWAHGVLRSVIVLLSAALALVGSQLLKENWLERPQLFEFDAANTFPSGHMTVFAVVGASLIWAVPKVARAGVTVVVALLMATVSWQLLEYGWHRPSDVIGAQALVLVLFALASAFTPRRAQTNRRQSRVMSAFAKISSWSMIVLGMFLVLCGIAMVFFASGLRSGELMLNGGEVSLIGLSFLSARTLWRLSP